ncbi:MAG: peptide chain release factor 2 [Candidatus Eiseniibacteriota bacterium]|nr:MAG: peptide chain release factor 2 [Candidatus Eisenbacteria bacterium]
MWDEIRARIESCEKSLRELSDYLDVAVKREEVARIEQEMSKPGFWDREDSQKVVQELGPPKRILEEWTSLSNRVRDLRVLLELAEEEQDETALQEAATECGEVETLLSDFRLRSLLNGEHDRAGAIVSIHPGAGGTESQDWAEILTRMYLRWLESRGFRYSILDYQAGEEAGIKDATIQVDGEYAYGYLKGESGVHRLVRISPFDAAQRRHTSFASVFVFPQLDEAIEVAIADSDLRVDTFRASGAGGQHVNKTDSAVRITHIPTGIVVQCQSERSQHRNRDNALKVLRARLYMHYQEQQRKALDKLHDDKKEIAWGSQIRSYVFQPYTLVKDHRTGHETADVGKVLDGRIDDFINAFLAAKGRP